MRRRAFSLIEVVAAVGILAVTVVVVLALTSPVVKSVSNSAEAEAAARVVAAVTSRVRFADLPSLLKTSAELKTDDANPRYDPSDGRDPKILFATVAGEAGLYDATRKVWVDSSGNALPTRDLFFEVALVRNDALSPVGADATASVLAYTLRVRWPVFRPTADPARAAQPGAGQTGTVTYDHSQQQVLYFSSSVTR
jgi:type II secretory pathway pseudopilin PulG